MIYTLNDELLDDMETPEGNAWLQFLLKFATDWEKLKFLKQDIEDPEDDIFSHVPFQEMLRQAIDTRPFSTDALIHYINLSFGPGDEEERDAVYGLLEVAYQYLFEDAPLESVGDYIKKAQEQIRMEMEKNGDLLQQLLMERDMAEEKALKALMEENEREK